MPPLRALALGALTGLVITAPALAAPPGTPDPSFGQGGVTRAETPHDALPVTALRSGEQVVGVATTRRGGAFVAAFRASDGARVAGYGGTIDLYGGQSATVIGAVREAGGRIVLAAWGAPETADEPRIELLGLDAEGHLDPTFGTGGRVLLPDRAEAHDLALAADGTLVVGGELELSDTESRALLARVSADGHALGTATAPKSALHDPVYPQEVRAVVPLPDGSALLVGTDRRGFIVRFGADGTFDAGYGTGGVARFGLGPEELLVDDAILQDSGHILIGGAVLGDLGRSVGVSLHAVLLRATTGGRVDPGWGHIGRGTSNGVAELSSLHLEGTKIVAGAAYDDRLVRFDGATGRPDLSFGVGGVSLRPRQDLDWVDDLTLDGSTALIAARSYLPDELERLNVLRVRLDGTGIPKPTAKRVTLTRRSGRGGVAVPLATRGQHLRDSASVPLEPRVVGTDYEEGIYTPPATRVDAIDGTMRVTGLHGRADVHNAKFALRRVKGRVAGLDLIGASCPKCELRASFRVRGPFEVRYGRTVVRNRSHGARFVVLRRRGHATVLRRRAGRLSVTRVHKK